MTAEKAAKSNFPREKEITVKAPNIEANTPPAKPSNPSITPPDQVASITVIKKGIYQRPIEISPTKGTYKLSQPSLK